jgi:hypothetical protein
MTRYDEEFLAHLKDTIGLFGTAVLWKWYAALVMPVCLAYFFANGYFFIALFVLGCFFCRSAKLGGLVGWFIVSAMILLFFSFPEQGHYIDAVLRVPRRGALASEIISSAELMSRTPKTFSGRLFAALVYGLWAGGTVGLGIGMLGRIFLGKNPNSF